MGMSSGGGGGGGVGVSATVAQTQAVRQLHNLLPFFCWGLKFNGSESVMERSAHESCRVDACKMF